MKINGLTPETHKIMRAPERNQKLAQKRPKRLVGGYVVGGGKEQAKVGVGDHLVNQRVVLFRVQNLGLRFGV
jgi:hypothetical protein